MGQCRTAALTLQIKSILPICLQPGTLASTVSAGLMTGELTMNLRCTLLLICVLLASCQSNRIHTAAPPALQLTHADVLSLPDNCHATGSIGIDFTVDAHGRTSDIKPASAPPCVQQALSAWVESFQYAPIGAATVTRMEWLLVEARRGS
jgi:hypothetical protein